jgi:hypothetical protein
MLTSSRLRSQVDALWDKFWSGELANTDVRLRNSPRVPKSEPYEPPLTSFGADAVDKWFTEKEVKEIVGFANHLVVERGI